MSIKIKLILLLTFALLESCSIQSSGQNGTAGKTGAPAKGAEQAKNGAAGEKGKDKNATIGLDIHKKSDKE
jgi:hypothetical protein